MLFASESECANRIYCKAFLSLDIDLRVLAMEKSSIAVCTAFISFASVVRDRFAAIFFVARERKHKCYFHSEKMSAAWLLFFFLKF